MGMVMKWSIGLQGHSAFLFGCIVLVAFLGRPADRAAAAVYECKGTTGSKVLTDRPKGLQGCVLIETLAPSPSGRGAPPPESPPLEQSQDQPPPAPIPLPVIPQISPPHEPVQSGSASDQPGTVSGHDGRSCPPGINPLNPLARGHCSPDASQSPDTTQEPQPLPQ